MDMRSSLYYLAVLGFLLLEGCQSALLTIKDEGDARAERIEEKQRELEDLEAHNEALKVEKERLLTELDKRELSLSDLSLSLVRLRQENEKIVADSVRLQKQKKEVDEKIMQYENEIQHLTSDGELSVEEKERRIKYLKEEIRAYLEFGLALQ